jgi:hypothetical protein
MRCRQLTVTDVLSSRGERQGDAPHQSGCNISNLHDTGSTLAGVDSFVLRPPSHTVLRKPHERPACSLKAATAHIHRR